MISAGDIIDRSIQLYRRRFTAVLKLIFWNLLAGLAMTVVETLVLWIYPNGSPAATVVDLGAEVLAGAVAIFTLVLLIRFVRNEIHGENEPNTWRAAAGVFWRTAGVWLVSFALIFLGLFALVVPGLIFWTWFAFAPQAAALEKIKFFKIFQHSRELSAGRFPAVFWRLFAPFAFFTLLQVVLILIVILVSQGAIRGIWSIELSYAGAPLWFLLLANILTELVRGLTVPLFVFPLTILYFALKEKPVGSESR